MLSELVNFPEIRFKITSVVFDDKHTGIGVIFDVQFPGWVTNDFKGSCKSVDLYLPFSGFGFLARLADFSWGLAHCCCPPRYFSDIVLHFFAKSYPLTFGMKSPTDSLSAMVCSRSGSCGAATTVFHNNLLLGGG